MRLKSPRHAHRLGSLFRKLLASALACGAIGCGAQVEGESKDAGDDKCRAVTTADAGAFCSSWTVELEGDCSGDAAPADLCSLCGTGSSSGAYCKLEGSTLSCSDPCVMDGRRPPVDLAPPEGRDLVGRFVRMAYFEAVSVTAFETLRRELVVHRAPRSLVVSMRRAREDERRHARMAAAMARRFGAERVDVEPLAPPTTVRSLEEIAVENAAEGCARETFGAMIATLRARTASTRTLRRFFARIARDETRHAAVAFRLHAWLWPRLTPNGRARVLRAFRDSLEPESYRAVDPLAATLGTPPPAELATYANALRDALSTRGRRVSSTSAT